MRNMTSYEKSTDALFVADGGLRSAAPTPVDPFQALDDLMVVVEALCPVWPQRATFTHEARNLL
jgi:hypothetical protein